MSLIAEHPRTGVSTGVSTFASPSTNQSLQRASTFLTQTKLNQKNSLPSRNKKTSPHSPTTDKNCFQWDSKSGCNKAFQLDGRQKTSLLQQLGKKGGFRG